MRKEKVKKQEQGEGRVEGKEEKEEGEEEEEEEEGGGW